MKPKNIPRRDFLKKSLAASAAMYTGVHGNLGTDPEKPTVTVVNPLNRVPVSLIIDDSTALVNMAHFGIPQFHEVFPDNYPQDWRKLPREIPDSFVREFGEWCLSQGIKGKYSMVPYPACTGWLHRFIPGWTKKELDESLKLVRELMMPNWDIHPEMISHTRVINIKTGQPYPDAVPEYMENWEWSQNKSSDEIASYMAYALNILKEAGFICEGITTPGGFGSRNMENLARGTLEAVRDVFQADIGHFFRDVITDPGQSVEPQLFRVSGLDTGNPQCSVHIIGCTDDWFGGWDGLTPGNADLHITEDLQKGRLVEVIDRKEPAFIVCHWPGVYFNGGKTGFNICKTVISRLNQKYNNLIWMKNSEIARYWAAKKLTEISSMDHEVVFTAPFAAERFTVHIHEKVRKITLKHEQTEQILEEIKAPLNLKQGSFCTDASGTLVSFELKKGITRLGFLKTLSLLLLLLILHSCAFSPKICRKLLEDSMKQKYDMIVVPGVPFENGRWSITMKERVCWSKYLYDKGIAKNVMYSGTAVYTPYVEGKVMALYAEKLGIRKEKIYTETLAEHSTENIYYGYKKARKLGFEHVALASDPFQTKMLRRYARKIIDPSVGLIPIVMDTLKVIISGISDPEIDYQQAFVKDFVPLPERENFFERWKGTRGHDVDTSAYR